MHAAERAAAEDDVAAAEEDVAAVEELVKALDEERELDVGKVDVAGTHL